MPRTQELEENETIRTNLERSVKKEEEIIIYGDIMSPQRQNPFAVQTPEDIPAPEVISLFVEEFTDFHKIPKQGHTFVNGSRGSGKSMIFRYLEPDCQCIALNNPVHELPFFSIYVPIKKTELRLTEFDRLENSHANFILNEHFMSTYVAVKIFDSLKKVPIKDRGNKFASALRKYYKETLIKLLNAAGWKNGSTTISSKKNFEECLLTIIDLFDSIYSEVILYLKRLSFTDTPVPYSGPLFGYLDFITPLIYNLKNLPFMPDGPIYLLIDDADNLSYTQTMILNSWVSYRTSAQISLKISTQINYKTYRISTGQRIDTPHDYSEVNISDIYTSQKNRYRARIKKIFKKRLIKYGIKVAPENFFPMDKKQENEIVKIAERLKADWATKGRGFRPSDDALRYARPTYIANLKGHRKSGSTYSYAGFDQLVHISSGIVRFFLEPASLMYGEQLSRNKGEPVEFISPSIQNSIIRNQSDNYLFSEFDKIIKDETSQGVKIDKLRKLKNLINALGGVFHKILISDASERRVFSIAFSDTPDDEVKEILDLGVRYGYFHRSTIGNKEGTGRTWLYILSRRLAPTFLLDPTSFAGYKFITNNTIKEAMYSPKKFINKIGNKNINTYLDDPQRSLFEED